MHHQAEKDQYGSGQFFRVGLRTSVEWEEFALPVRISYLVGGVDLQDARGVRTGVGASIKKAGITFELNYQWIDADQTSRYSSHSLQLMFGIDLVCWAKGFGYFVGHLSVDNFVPCSSQ